jgi:hypothetical protein
MSPNDIDQGWDANPSACEAQKPRSTVSVRRTSGRTMEVAAELFYLVDVSTDGGLGEVAAL